MSYAEASSSLRFGLAYNQIQRDDAEQQLLDTYVKNAAELKPVSTRKLPQAVLRAAALVDYDQGNSAAAAVHPPSLAALALEVTARNFPKLLRITQSATGEEEDAEPREQKPAAATADHRQSRRVAAIASGRAFSGVGSSSRYIGSDGKPSPELSRHTHDLLRLLQPQHLADLQILLQRYHRRSLTILTLRRYFLPPINPRLNISPAIPLVTEQPDSGPVKLVSAATAQAKHLTHASLIALNRLDAKFFAKFALQATALEYLDLSACLNVNANLIWALAKGCKEEGKISRIRYLNLDATAVGAQGVALVIANFHQLEVLKLANVHGLDDAVLPATILHNISTDADQSNSELSSRPLCRLRSLKLRRTQVGNESLSLLLGMCDPEILHTLDLGFTRCTLEGLLEAIQAPASNDSQPSNEPNSGERSNVHEDEHSGSGARTPILPNLAHLPFLPSSNEGPSDGRNEQEALQPPPFTTNFNFRKLSLSGLRLHSSRGAVPNRLRPLQDLLRTQTDLQSLYLQRVPHFSQDWDHVQELTAVLKDGLRNILEQRAGPNGLPDPEYRGAIEGIGSPVPLFRKLVLSNNPALAYSVHNGATRSFRGWVYAHQLKEQEEAEAGELAKLMRTVGVFCERILELDHTGIDDAMLLDALQRAGMVLKSEDTEAKPEVQDTESSATGRTRSGRAAPKRADRKGKAKAKETQKPNLIVGNLRRINLTDAKVSDNSLRPLLEANPYLQEIDLTSCRSVPIGARRNYFEHVYGEDSADYNSYDDTEEDSDAGRTRRTRNSRKNPSRSRSDRRAVVARRQAASGTTLTRQEMHDDDFVANSDSDYDEYASLRSKRRSSSTPSPRKRAAPAGSRSPSKQQRKSSASAQRKAQEEMLDRVKNAKTARLAATARLHASGSYPSTSGASSFSETKNPYLRNRPSASSSSSTHSPQKRRYVDEDTDEEFEASDSEEDDDDDESDDDADSRPLAHRVSRTARTAAASGPSRRSRPKRVATRGLSFVDKNWDEGDEENDPDFELETSQRRPRVSSSSPRKPFSASGSAPRSSLRQGTQSPFTSSAPAASTSTSEPSSSRPQRNSTSRRSASPTRARSSRSRELQNGAQQGARDARAAKRARN
ncbi:hypothetical protein OC846_005051 [Tilletia horrida]|uniref:Uncharacterized protein n=1 Tax=Tilletia horrida TaxID=155126 RepID=A0AAN6GMJ7_9BASI|nr:hypothetical protein OC846_005051 [Tilletia horrida]